MADFNNDGMDDLSIAHHGGELQFYLGNGVGFTSYNLDLPSAQTKPSAFFGRTSTTMGTKTYSSLPISG